jgi:HAE1 family hydrophobic/amphiphilic exporter-1
MRWLVGYCVRRPVGVLAIYFGLAVMGVFAWQRLPQELMPDLRFPQLSVVTVLPNGSPEEVENLVSKPIEQMVGTVKNVRQVESRSKEQVSVVNIQFRWDTDMDAALLWVQEKLGLIQDLLPLETKKPEVTRFNPFDRPILLVGVTGNLPPADVQHVVETRIRPSLEKTTGVSGVEVSGGMEREIQVNIDAQRLAGHRLSINEVSEALRRRNVSRSAGSASEGMFDYPVTVTGVYDEVKAIGDTIVRSDSSGGKEGSAMVRLSSLGEIVDTFRERTSFARYDGKDNVSVAVYKRAEAYPIDVSRAARATLGDLQRQLPQGLAMNVIYDQSHYIKEGISDVIGNVILGGILAYVVLWAFLRSHTRSIIVGLTIPLALLLTVAVFWKIDQTLNLLTLGGLALGVGMLVDSAVVIIEDISRHRDMGKTLEESILDGAHEVGGAVFYSVLTTIVAFAPIPFAAVGVAQKVFTPIALAVIISQCASLLVGFTFVPSLAALMLENKKWDQWISKFGFARRWPALTGKKVTTQVPHPPLRGTFRQEGKENKEFPSPLGRGQGEGPEQLRKKSFWARWFQPVAERGRVFFGRAHVFYERLLMYSVHNPRRVLWIVGLSTVLNGAGLMFIRKEAMPDVDQNQFLMKMSLPTGTRLEVTDSVLRKIEERLTQIPEVAHRNVIAGASGSSALGALGPHQGQIVVDLADRVPKPGGGWRARRRTARQVMEAVAAALKKEDLEGARVDFEAQGGDVFSQVFGRAGADLVVEVQGSDLDGIKKVTESFKEKVRAIPGVSKVEDSRTVPSLQWNYELDESRLARDGLTVSDVADVVLAGVHGQTPTSFREQGKEVPIRVRLRESDRKDATALAGILVPSPLEKGGAHPLEEYGALTMAPGPSEIRRRDQQRTALVSVFLTGRKTDDVLPDIKKAMAAVRNQKDATVELGHEMEETKASLNSLFFGLVAALALVYIVLVAQFNVLWIPLLAMVAVPLAVNGVTPALLLTGNTLNLMSGQGLLMLAGIVVNNSLMLLEFIQQKRSAGAAPLDAAVEASRIRLRPILMTMTGTIAGLIPLALGIGKGAKLQAPMAIVVIVGLAVSTVLTLVVLPALYLEARRYTEE